MTGTFPVKSYFVKSCHFLLPDPWNQQEQASAENHLTEHHQLVSTQIVCMICSEAGVNRHGYRPVCFRETNLLTVIQSVIEMHLQQPRCDI